MFTYVSGSALNQKDSMGLSPENITKIQNTFNQVIKDMTSKGERLNIYIFNNVLFYNKDDDNGSWPTAAAGTLSVIFLNGQSTLIYGQQWERVQEELNNLDDKWKFDCIYESMHQYGIGTSNNSNDSKIYNESLKNKFTEKFR